MANEATVTLPCPFGIDAEEWETAAPSQQLALFAKSMALLQAENAKLAAETQLAKELAASPIKFSVSRPAGSDSGYPGAIEIDGLQIGWMSVRTDAAQVRRLIAMAESFEKFVVANGDYVRQDDADTRFNEARAAVKAAAKAKKAEKNARAA